MALPVSHKLFIEPTLGVAYASFSGSTQVSNPSFFLGDKAQLEIYLVKDTGLATFPRQEADYSGLSFKVAVGQIDESPTGGTWLLSYGGNTTSALAYNATAAQVQTALNALASITSAGGVVVTKVGDNYNVVFNQDGARTELTSDAASLTPLSTAGISVLQEGTVSAPAIYLVHLQRTVAAYATSFTQVSASVAAVTALSAWDGGRATYRVSISPDPKGGTFTLAFDAQTGTDVTTSAISAGASALDVQNALNRDALLNKVTVQQVGAFAWDVTVTTQPGTNGLTVSGAGLLSFSGYKGELNLNTASAIALLDGAEFIQTTLEVEITSDSKPLTVLQIPCLLKSAVVDEAAIEPLQLETYLTQAEADGRYYRLSNNLSEGTASTIRTNLDVYSTTQVDTAVALKADASDLALKADLAGDTFTGKVTFTPVAGVAGLNIGIGGNSTASTTAGDLYINTGSATLGFRDANGVGKLVACLTNGNAFTAVQSITVNSASTALRVTQNGSGLALLVEDGSENPDQSATYIDNAGRMGVLTQGALSEALTVGGNIEASNVKLTPTGGGSFYFQSGNYLTELMYSGDNPFTSGSFSSADYPYELEIQVNGSTYKVPARIP